MTITVHQAILFSNSCTDSCNLLPLIRLFRLYFTDRLRECGLRFVCLFTQFTLILLKAFGDGCPLGGSWGFYIYLR